MQALRQKVGFIGPRLVGKQVGGIVDKLFGSLSQAGNVANLLSGWSQVYADNNKGADCGELHIENLTENSVDVVTTSPLDEGFHLGVGEGFIRFYNKMHVWGNCDLSSTWIFYNNNWKRTWCLLDDCRHS